MHLPWSRSVETRSDPFLSIGDPVLAGYFGVTPTFAGVSVGESTALGISAFWRAVSLISGTIAGLPLKTYRDTAEGERQRMTSFLDDPGGPDGPTPFEWKETVVAHLLVHGNTFLAHRYNQGGAMIGTLPVHPTAVSIDPPRKDTPTTYRASMADGSTREFTPKTMTHIPGLSFDGIRGLSVISVARQALGTTIAGDRAAARMFGNGMLISGLVTPDEDIDEDEAKIIKAGLDKKMSGWEHASEIAFVNRKLKFDPWTMSAEDAQFLQSRAFQVEDVARWTGVPPHLLMQTEKQTSWGTGVAEQNRGLSRFTLLGWTSRIEQRLSRLLPAPRFAEFDFAGLERPTPEQEIELLIKQVEAGILTKDEARHIRNMPPLTSQQAVETSEDVEVSA